VSILYLLYFEVLITVLKIASVIFLIVLFLLLIVDVCNFRLNIDLLHRGLGLKKWSFI